MQVNVNGESRLIALYFRDVCLFAVPNIGWWSGNE